MRTKKTTITDIAKRVNLSKTTVSYAFNNPNRLPKETVQRILEVARELRYVPDPIARSMTSGKIGSIGILLPMPIPEIIPNPFLSDFLYGISEVCAALGFSISLLPPIEGSINQAITRAAVDGFITLGVEKDTETLTLIERRNIPFIMVDSDPIEEIPSVNIEDKQGAYDAMEYVLKAGHREIVIVGIKSESDRHYKEYVGTLRDRINGYIDALNSYELSIDDRHVRLIESESTFEGGKETYKQIIKENWNPTAIVAMSDIIAIGILIEAKNRNMDLPKDLSVIGFDDIYCASLINPELTTVNQPIYYKGELAAKILINNLDGKKDNSHIVLPTKLIIRNSVRNL